jgi:Xaa-Pro aminopeptidase
VADEASQAHPSVHLVKGKTLTKIKDSIASFVIILLVLAINSARGQSVPGPLPTLREQAAIQQEWLKIRLDRVLPQLMRENNVQMWIVDMREYNEDPVFSSLVSATTFSARRRSIYVLFDRGPERGVERLALGGSSQGGLFVAYRDSTLKNAELWGDLQWTTLANAVRERDPKTISVNISNTHAFSDGLSAGEWELMQKALGSKYVGRIVRAERLPLDYIAVRIPEMLPWYKKMMEASRAIIVQAFSSNVITPGKTTAQDIVWWMRQKVQELGLTTWFHPSVDIQRRGADFANDPDPVIQKGDVLHCDFGVTGMRLNTDTQHMGYVLRDGETDVPAGIQAVLAKSNRLQDIVINAMKPGRTGNQVLELALAQMKKEGIDGSVYSHPIGEHGHGAGAIVGLWDRQTGVPGRGDVPLIPSTWYSIELQAGAKVPEWNNQVVRSPQEEDVAIGQDGSVRWILERQTEFHLVR